MRIAIRHELSITPPEGTSNMVFQLLLTPSDGPGQTVESWDVEMGGIETAARFNDGFGNQLHFANQARPEGPIAIVASGVVDTRQTNGVLGKPLGEPVPALYLRTTTLTKVPVTLWGKFRSMKDSRIALLHGLMERVGDVLGTVAVEAESQSQSQSQMHASGGQSQSQSQGPAIAEPAQEKADAALLAHGFIGACRALDIPARYVSGYLLGDEHPARHAWAEAFDPGLGWIGFDPLLQLCPSGDHVRRAVGLDALSTTHVRAVPNGEGVKTVSVSVSAV